MKKILLSTLALSVLEESSSFLFLPMLGGLMGGLGGGLSGGGGGGHSSIGCKTHRTHQKGSRQTTNPFELTNQSTTINTNINIKTFTSTTPSLLNQQGNFIINGYFNYPPLTRQTFQFITLQGWRASQIERGPGFYYNKRWGSAVVVELDGNQNNRLSQSISLEPGRYILYFKWAARSGYVRSSAMNILWNNKSIFRVQANDQQIYEQRIPINVQRSGSYTLQIVGEGASDTYGMTIANFRLYLDRNKPKPKPRPKPIPSLDDYQWQYQQQIEPQPKPKPKPRPKPVPPPPYQQQQQQQQILPKPKPRPKPTPPDQSKNTSAFTLVSSDSFSLTINKYFKFWELRGFTRSSARKFNPLWANNLDALISSVNSEDILRQKTFLGTGVYLFEFDHLAKKDSTKPEKFIVLLNDKKIGNAQPTNNKIKTFSAKFNVQKAGNFRFEIRVDRSSGSDRIGLINPRLTLLTQGSPQSVTIQLKKKKIPLELDGKSGLNIGGINRPTSINLGDLIQDQYQDQYVIDNDAGLDFNTKPRPKNKVNIHLTNTVNLPNIPFDISTGNTMDGGEQQTGSDSLEGSQQGDVEPVFTIQQYGEDS